MNPWAEIIDMNSAALKPQEIHLDAQQHGKITGRCVIIDSGRRDLLYCIHENSTADAPRTYRYSCVYSRPLDLQIFEEYLRSRALVIELLQRHHTKTTTNYLAMYPLHQKLKLSKYIRRQKANKDMVPKLKSKFENDAVFVMDNYSAPNAPEYRIYDHIKDEIILKAFIMVYNRDLAACLNMIHIVRNLRWNGEIPERFQRAGAEGRGSEENEERRVLPRIL
ncbi:hypothetical protein G6F43_001227 [Rhizopus delemar]|nr:hypothetical protein G6F43_001227 [Rhizopus delemar]